MKNHTASKIRNINFYIFIVFILSVHFAGMHGNLMLQNDVDRFKKFCDSWDLESQKLIAYGILLRKCPPAGVDHKTWSDAADSLILEIRSRSKQLSKIEAASTEGMEKRYIYLRKANEILDNFHPDSIEQLNDVPAIIMKNYLSALKKP